MDKTKWNLDAPFAKTVETEDGGREIWGFASLERVDKSNEIADFNGTVKAFEKWSQDTEKRTGGKSKGNVRLMHQPVAVGKTIHWEPSETSIDVDGVQQVVKGIWVGCYVPPTKPDVIRDIDEGILSAFSIGGAYEKRWWDKDAQAFRYIPSLSEYSLVDNPCCDGADIVNVISKGDGPWSKKEGENVQKSMEAKGTYEELRSLLYSAINCCDALCGDSYGWCDCSIVATYPQSVVVYEYRQGKYFEMPYTYDGAGVTLGDPFEVIQDYIPLEAIQNEEAQKASRNEFLNVAISKFNEKADQNAKEIGEKIAKGATSLKGGEYIFENGKVIEKKEGENKAMNLEQIKKASEVAGIDISKIQEFFKALEAGEVAKSSTEPDEPSAPVAVTVVDGDGDDDGNKEFPNSPSGSEKINIEAGISSVKDAEKESRTEMTPAPEVPIENGEANKNAGAQLQKEGKVVSAKNANHMVHAVNHIDAVLKGADYTADDHLIVENGTAGEGPNSGLESPEVAEKVFGKIFTPIIESAVSKAIDAVMQKSANSNQGLEELSGKFEALAKGLASHDALKKAMDEIESIKTLVKEIHETPQAGGPALNGAGMIKSFNSANLAQQDNSSLEKFVAEITDPVLKDRVGQEIAMRKAKEAFGR